MSTMMGKKRRTSSSTNANDTQRNGYHIARIMEQARKLPVVGERRNNGWLLLGCSIGIFLSYFIYGLLQETM